MKNVCCGLFACVVALAATSSAFATPVFKKAFDEQYGKNEAIKKASEEAKCNVCHFGNSKKNKNDYGKALSELLKKDNYKEDRVKAEPEAVKKELDEAFKKVEAAKSKGGDTFGDRLKAGKLPGSPE